MKAGVGGTGYLQDMGSREGLGLWSVVSTARASRPMLRVATLRVGLCPVFLEQHLNLSAEGTMMGVHSTEPQFLIRF